MSNYTYFCDEQEEKLEVIHAVVFLVRNALVFPLGIFLDMYGKVYLTSNYTIAWQCSFFPFFCFAPML
jgi:competence protein ComGF